MSELSHTPIDDGFRLRRATAADQAALARFQVAAHWRADAPEASAYLATYTHELFTRPHPLLGVADFLLLTTTADDEIVASAQLFRQTWHYAGIPLPVGQIEMVGTAAPYRRRGLARRLIHEAHQISTAQGDLVQVIGGNPNFYRQFGYEYALCVGDGRGSYCPAVSPNPPSTADLTPFRVRPATTADLPFLVRADAEAGRRNLLHCPRDGTLWRYELSGRSEENRFHYQVRVIETATSEAVGYFAYRWSAGEPWLVLVTYEIVAPYAWLTVTPWLLDYLHSLGQQSTAPGKSDQPADYGGCWLWLGTEHPAYHASPSRLTRSAQPTVFYVRVPDIAALLRHLAPVLEQRLPGTVAANYSGALTISFYHDGVCLRFVAGRITEVLSWQPADQAADAAFPGLTLLPLLFGYRTLAQQEAAYPDCYAASDQARALLTALFPARPSRIWTPY
jgi:GNAT superfamily N-acetyltransferase